MEGERGQKERGICTRVIIMKARATEVGKRELNKWQADIEKLLVASQACRSLSECKIAVEGGGGQRERYLFV